MLFNQLFHVPLLAVLLLLCGVFPARAQAPYTLTRTLFSPNTPAQTDAEEGFAVATDGNYVVVGVPYADGTFTDEGLVRVYDATSGALLWTLREPVPAEFDYFGSAVAISGSRVVVGAYGVDVGAGTLLDPRLADAGAAYVFDLAGATPTVPVVVLPNPAPNLSDNFGEAVAISGSRVVIGAPYDDAGAIDAGAAYVFDLASVTPALPVAVLKKPVPTAYDIFGYSVAISGSRVIVGDLAEDFGALNAGAAYVFDLVSATPSVPVAVLHDPAPAPLAYFGNSVAISGSRAVVGEYGSAFGAVDAGSAFVFDLASATPAIPVAVLRDPAPAPSDVFGSSVAIAGTRVVVGAPGAGNFGAAYVFDFGNETPLLALRNPAPNEPGAFGFATAISNSHLAIGAPVSDANGRDDGAACVFDPGITPTFPQWKAAHFTAADLANPAVSGPAADPDGDGVSNALEYALALPPTAPGASGLPVASVKNIGGTNYLTLVFRRLIGAGDLLYTPQTSGSAGGAWNSDAVQIGPPVPNDDGTQTVTFRDSVPSGGAGRFMRLQISIAP